MSNDEDEDRPHGAQVGEFAFLDVDSDEEVKPSKYRCRGCGYAAAESWACRIENGKPTSRCPGCGKYYNIISKSSRNSSGRITLGQATMDAHKDMVYIPTGIPELDKVIGGGEIESQGRRGGDGRVLVGGH